MSSATRASASPRSKSAGAPLVSMRGMCLMPLEFGEALTVASCSAGGVLVRGCLRCCCRAATPRAARAWARRLAPMITSPEVLRCSHAGRPEL